MLEVIVFVGLPGAGKSTFFERRFASTHVLVSRDRFRNNRNPSRRQRQLIEEALGAGRSVVVDNTSVTREARAAIVDVAREHGARVIGYLFTSEPRGCLARNARRTPPTRVPDVAIHAMAKKLTWPTHDDGFDELWEVRTMTGASFEVRRAP